MVKKGHHYPNYGVNNSVVAPAASALISAHPALLLVETLPLKSISIQRVGGFLGMALCSCSLSLVLSENWDSGGLQMVLPAGKQKDVREWCAQHHFPLPWKINATQQPLPRHQIPLHHHCEITVCEVPAGNALQSVPSSKIQCLEMPLLILSRPTEIYHCDFKQNQFV